MWKQLLVVGLTATIFIACNTTTTTLSKSVRISPTYEGPPELAYSSSVTYSSGTVTITGTANFNARKIYSSGLGSADPNHATKPALTKPIRYAEVRVTDSSGNLVQGTETLSDGTFSFVVPQISGNYTVYIMSRANNSNLKASILNSPEFNSPYSISKTFSGSASASIGTVTATGDGETLAGAFNILDQFVEANNYLRAQVATCATTFTGCTNFTVAPKVSAYWTKGFNPGSYYNSGPVSFYVRNYSRIFILGGENGDVNTSDTDHFDNSVIIHEYGHFLEDAYFVSDSPGGQHSGNKIIDPRLAWSEGWGNFIQAAVRNTADYQDSYGNIDGTTGLYFNLDIESASVGHDVPAASGEGNFREFSITRFLWDAIDNTPAETVHSVTDNISSGFMQIWASLTKTTNGWMNSNISFHNIGHMHIGQRWLESNASGGNWSDIRTIEYHQGDTTDYANYVSTGSTCTYSMTPASVSGDSGSFSTSDLFRNNDFYHLKVSSGSTVTISLAYDDADQVGTLADLDLYIYNSSARYGNSADMIGSSINDPANVAVTQNESITTTLAAGNYLINVMVYTKYSIGGSVTYKLKLNGNDLCPTSIP